MRSRFTAGAGPPTDDERQGETTEPGSRDTSLRRLVALAVGLVAVGYLVVRYLDRADDTAVENARDLAPSLEAVRDRTSNAVPGEFQQIPIGESDEPDASDEDADELSADETSAADVIDDAETNVDVTDEQRSPEEIEERAREERAEPGEMAIDDDVADVIDGEGSDDETEEEE
ncbi:hypothetical protein [Natrialba swarupiae]|uniref:Uncharacterized protein n=1 Tax=Natrialba swarupiae TaxID=2448032 RepID=A0A5D5AP93_9EURY|nr:hypothetical protein [Natrialba swarupiae]TYT63506.1 hypothetical protein FYC77_02720 [Natrialba swarupiae]